MPNFIQFFGIASILYAAAVAVDAYYFMMGFGVPTSNKARQRTESNVRGTNTSLDYYNRDTETFEPAQEIIGIDVNVVVNANKTISTDSRDGASAALTPLNAGMNRQVSAPSPWDSWNRHKISLKPIARKYKIFHVCVYSYLAIGVLCLNFAQKGSSVKPYIYPGIVCVYMIIRVVKIYVY